jgi:hypothetical protein
MFELLEFFFTIIKIVIEGLGRVAIFVLEILSAAPPLQRSAPENRFGPFGIKSISAFLGLLFLMLAIWLQSLG